MGQYRVVHTGEDIHWVGQRDYPGASVLWIPSSEGGDVMAHPTWYRVVGQGIELRPGWETIRDAELAIQTSEAARKAAIRAAQVSEGLREVTIEQANNYIDNQFDLTDLDATGPDIQSATTIAQLRAATYASILEIRQLFNRSAQTHKREIPYILD